MLNNHALWMQDIDGHRAMCVFSLLSFLAPKTVLRDEKYSSSALKINKVRCYVLLVRNFRSIRCCRHEKSANSMAMIFFSLLKSI
jgi:hypothetical protein